MFFSTNKQKGNTALGMAIAYFTSNNYTVSLPLNDTQDYDLIVEKDGIIETVQVKSSGCKNKACNYQVALKSCGGTKGKTYKTFINTSAHLLFIFLEDRSIYLIPRTDIKNLSTITLSHKYVKYKRSLFT